MHGLSGQEILTVWERGQGRVPVDRGLILLSAACPEYSLDEIAEMSLGRRDGLLMRVRERTFGRRITLVADCSNCGERLEFQTDLSRFLSIDQASEPEVTLRLGDYEIRARAPNSLDIAAAGECDSLAGAREELLKRCVTEILRDEHTGAVAGLPAEIVEALGNRLAEAHPLSDIQLDVACPSCRHRSDVVFDIIACLWLEVSATAKRLLAEVHTLARAYGWTEDDILAMGAARRQLYLNMVIG